MVKTFSSMVSLGSEAPHFSLNEVVEGKRISLLKNDEYKASVVMFVCNHCPYVKHIMPELIRLANDYLPQKVRFIAINSNDTESYPEDAPDKMKSLALSEQFPFPYLFDETQEVAKAYQAACTPDFFVYDSQLLLVYRGQFDESRPGNVQPVTGLCLRRALNAILEGQALTETQHPSLGCNIKWKEA